jgi:hypothetical protein
MFRPFSYVLGFQPGSCWQLAEEFSDGKDGMRVRVFASLVLRSTVVSYKCVHCNCNCV